MIFLFEFLIALMALAIPFIVLIIIGLIIGSIKVVMEYQRGVKFTLGRYSGIMGPGLNFVIPFFQSWRRVDIRIVTTDIPKQEVMTKDNVPVNVNAVVYFKVKDPKLAILKVADYRYAVAKYAQTTLRDVAGELSLDDLLSKRDQTASKLKTIVDKATDPWGIDVTDIKLQDIELPQDLKRTIMKQAEAEREKRAVIIKAEGEMMAAENISKAAHKIAKSPGGLHLRTLHTLNDLSSDKSNTVIFAIPIEILDAIQGISHSLAAPKIIKKKK